MNPVPVLLWSGPVTHNGGTHTARVVAHQPEAGGWSLAVELAGVDAMGAEAWTPIPRESPHDGELVDLYVRVLEAALVGSAVSVAVDAKPKKGARP